MKYYNMYISLGKEIEKFLINKLSVNILTLHTPNELIDIHLSIENILYSEFRW